MNPNPSKTTKYYTGNSMKPTFRPLDDLIIESRKIHDVKTGDIIVFHPSKGSQSIVHRVIEIKGAGLVTQGDNNVNADNQLVTSENLIGKVVAYERNGKRKPVTGGQIGNSKLAVIRSRRKLLNQLLKSGLLQKTKHLIVGIPLYYAVPFHKITHTLLLKVGDEYQLQLFIGKLKIGKFPDKNQNWQINRFLRPFINISKLPEAINR